MHWHQMEDMLMNMQFLVITALSILGEAKQNEEMMKQTIQTLEDRVDLLIQKLIKVWNKWIQRKINKITLRMFLEIL